MANLTWLHDQNGPFVALRFTFFNFKFSSYKIKTRFLDVNFLNALKESLTMYIDFIVFAFNCKKIVQNTD